MSCAVNLVPAVRAQAHAFARRRRAWIAICAAGALIVALGCTAQYVTSRALERLNSQTDALGTQCTLMQTRVAAADQQRGELLARLKLIAAAHRRQPWAARLAGLTRSAPEGVFLTQLNISPAPLERAVPPPKQTPALTRDAPASGAAPPARPVPPVSVQEVRLQGLALDHTALIQLLNVLQNSPDWQHVELVRATSEPYGGRTVVSFEFDCRAEELTQ